MRQLTLASAIGVCQNMPHFLPIEYAESRSRRQALIFWNKSKSQPIAGWPPDLSTCVAYSGVYLDAVERRMPIAPNVASQQPKAASREAEKVKRRFGCWGVEAETRPQGCTGNLVFAYYGESDPYWFVLRSCSTACKFKGESVETLRRGDRGWDVTVGGFINNPKEEIERLKRQIEKAEMFRLRL